MDSMHITQPQARLEAQSIATSEKPPTLPVQKALQNNLKLDLDTKSLAKEKQPKSCLCGREFQHAWSHVVIQQPILTVIGICSDCSRTLRYGSHRERLSAASLLVRKASGERSVR